MRGGKEGPRQNLEEHQHVRKDERKGTCKGAWKEAVRQEQRQPSRCKMGNHRSQKRMFQQQGGVSKSNSAEGPRKVKMGKAWKSPTKKPLVVIVVLRAGLGKKPDFNWVEESTALKETWPLPLRGVGIWVRQARVLVRRGCGLSTRQFFFFFFWTCQF